jgi:hypothetical protein
MGSHLFTSRSGSNLGIRMRKKLTYLYSTVEKVQENIILATKKGCFFNVCILLFSLGLILSIGCKQVFSKYVFLSILQSLL